METQVYLHLLTTTELAERIIRHKDEIKRLYFEQERLLDEFLDRQHIWGKLFEVDGALWVLKDNFADGNKTFHTTAALRFDLKEAMQKDVAEFQHD